jgi:hypothetical protein
MIKNFIEYIKEELKDSTYMSAYYKLKRLGGSHIKRAESIRNWAAKKRSLGDVNVYLNIFEFKNERGGKTYQGIDLCPMDYKVKSSEKIIKNGPLPCFLSYVGLTESFEDDYDLDSENINEYLEWLAFNVYVYNEEVSEAANIFNFQVKLIWVSRDEFKIESLKISDTWDDYESIILFSDRKSALALKKVFKDGDFIFGNEILKDLFMKFSTREELEKLHVMFKEFPINQLYK